MGHVSVPGIKLATGIPSLTIRRTLRSGAPRHNRNPTSGTKPIINERQLRSLVRAVTSGADGRRASYIILARELRIEAGESTIRKALRTTGFQRYIVYTKLLISWINRKKRLKWAREKTKMRVIFLDENSFESG